MTLAGFRLAHLLKRRHEAPAPLGGVGATVQQLVEGFPLDEFHGQKRPAIGENAQVMHGRDVGMLQLPGDAGLVGEAPGRAGIGRVRLPQHLNRDLAAEHEVGGAVDDAHAAVGNLFAQLIARGGVRRLRGRANPSRVVRDRKGRIDR
jgi:hypothetical protein